MILAVDIGNTHIVLGCIEDDSIITIDRIETDRLKTDIEYAVILKGLLEFNDIDLNSFEGAVLSSVVPQITSSIRRAIKKVIGCDTLFVGAGVKTGLNILIDDPAQTGSDLVVAAVAALALYNTPLIVIDMGTATTISVIKGKADFIGGAILPGVGVALNALISNTSQLPYVSLEAPKKCISTNTIDCIKSGAVYGSASMIDGMIRRIESELGEKATVIATGGIASSIIPYCEHEIIYEPDLLLRGLTIVYNKNKKNYN